MEHAGAAEWDSLPAGVLEHIVRLHSLVQSLPDAKTRLRSVCRGWHASLPLGHAVPAHIWRWEEQMAAALAPQARAVTVLAPLPHAAASPLPQLARFPRLGRLTLRHIHVAALPALSGLTGLRQLDAIVYFPAADEGWLDWATGLTSLQRLHLTAALLRLQPEDGLQCLLPLRRHLRSLRLDGCMLLTDEGVPLLAQLSGLTRLEVTCCQASQQGVDALAAALPRLAHAELRLQDGVAEHVVMRYCWVNCGHFNSHPSQAGDRLVPLTAIGAGGGLTAHVSRAKANSLVAAAGQQWPGLGRLAVRHMGCAFLLTAEPSFQLMQRLTSLSLPRIQLPPDAARQLGACTALRELEVELNFTVRDEVLLEWRALAHMRCLRLAGNFYISEQAMAAVLAAMPGLQELRLEQMQGSGAMLGPLGELPALRTLELASCHLNDAQALHAALRGATGLAALRVQSCGIQSEVCEAVVAALPSLPHLRELQLALRRARYRPYRGLRSLHASSGMGWDGDALAAVAAAATSLRAVTLTDNVGNAVDAEWVAALAPLQRLSHLQLNSCRALRDEAVPPLCLLSSLTGLHGFRCPGLANEEARRQLRASLPCLADLSLHE
ncbi:hypothetical protein COHA_003663 [Chlorella ohadii]|uniref:Uncharacterized protein n=1 Tax=Chlorella ohadii TaxID=2649997 RepID=A0AAD5H3A8_9CHLO|nr:hypothetical protein COHA_003663 [Chlorella ohadii]